MIETYTSISKRILAGLFAMLMVLTLVPYTAIKASAADVSGFTFLVQHADGSPVEGAEVTVGSVYLTSDANKEHILKDGEGNDTTLTGTSDANGYVSFSEIDSLVTLPDSSTQDITLVYTISKDGYKSVVEETIDVTSTNINTSFDVTLLKVITDVFNVEGKTLTYTGSEQELVAVTGVDASQYTITYELDGVDKGTTVPTATEAGEYNVKVIVTSNDINCAAKEIDVTAEITATPTFSVTVTPVEDFTYDGKEHPLVTLEGLLDGDDVTYECDNSNATVKEDENGNKNIYATNAGEYNITVTVKREGYTDFVSTQQTIVISKATYTGISITANSLQYKEVEDENGNKSPVEQELVTVTGLPENTEGAKTWYLDENKWGDSLPKASAVRTTDISGSAYKVRLEIAESPNYEAWSSDDIEVEIGLGVIKETLDDLGVVITPEADLSYTGTPQKLLKKAEVKEGYTLKYRVGETGEFEEGIPEATKAGTYKIYVQICRDNFNNRNVEGCFPISVVIKKEAQTNLKFNQTQFTADGETTFELSDVEGKTYDFSATGGSSNENIEYTIESLIDDIPDDKTATIEADGKLTIKGVGVIKVTATRPGGTNYEDASISHLVVIKQTEDLLKLETKTVEYVLGTNGGTVSERKATKTNFLDFGEIEYSFVGSHPYLSISDEGKVTVNDIAALADAIPPETGVLEVTVFVNKKEVKSEVTVFGKTNEIEWAGGATAEYKIKISFETTPTTTPYTLAPATPNGADDWFTSAVTVTAPTGYTIAKEVNGSFASDVKFDDNGTHARYIYLKNTSTGGITNKIAVEYNNENLKIDTEAPTDIKFEYAISPTDEFLEVITLGFYNPGVKIKVTATDKISGVKEIKWEYKKVEAEGISTSILSGKPQPDEEILTLTNEGNGVCSAEFTLEGNEEEQYRGYIIATVTDNAGNSVIKADEDDPTTTDIDESTIFVVDTINPELTVTYSEPDASIKENEKVIDFYNNFEKPVEVKFTVKEINFIDGAPTVIIKKDNNNYEAISPVWVETDETDTYECVLTFDKKHTDGVYEISISYEDKSGNVMEMGGVETPTYTKSFTIDTKAPEINVVCEESSDKDTGKITVTAIFTVDELNFEPNAVKVTGSVTTAGETKNFEEPTLLSEVLPGGTWKLIDGKYTYKFNGVAGKDLISGNYDLTVYCTDKATNPQKETKKAEFTTDYDNPVVTNIEYSKSITDVILETVTLGFYKPNIEIKFTATDATSGVKEFEWQYVKQSADDGASDSIKAEYVSDKITKIEKNNDGTYSATLTLTAKEAEQYRGYIAVTATDNAGNKSDIVTDDGKVFVVDTINPALSVSYTASDNKDYPDFYNKDVIFTLIATEANFYPDDVKINVAKDGADPKPVQLADEDWSKGTNDVYTASFEIKDDGDYEITITYKDKSTNDAIITDGKDCKGTITTVEDESGNKTTTYTKSFTIDKTAPVISKVEFDKEVKVVSTKDNRNYYAEEQTATVTITEHNFDADKVKFNVTATDANGETFTVNVEETENVEEAENVEEKENTIIVKKSKWTDVGDKHTVTLTFKADANYTFDIECVDKATNAIEDYTANEFTVDKTAPEKLMVSYSKSVTARSIEKITFGFYKAPVEVTLTAEDATARVNAFTFGYEKASFAGDVNTEEITKSLAEADIQINGSQTTATFKIPETALGKGTQLKGNVKFIAIDRSGNTTDKTDEKGIIVDNIAPVANVTFSNPVNTVGDISYYAGDINATITINEENFFSDNYDIILNKDGVDININQDISWTEDKNAADVHVGTYTIKADGDYTVRITGADESGNRLKTYTSKQLTIDTDIKEPTFSINGAAKSGIGGAYKGDISVSFNYEDENFDNAEIKLVKTSLNSVEDVTSKYINANNEEKGGSGSFSIPAEVANDGIYTLTVNMNDKAKHTSSAELKFTVNRYGSVYEYSDYLISLIKDGGQYVTIKDGATAAITEDIVITEYNATPILSDSLKVLITRDGEVIEADYTTTPSNLDSATIGNSGWYQYVYTIKASNFAEDGVYKISLVSQYSANDAENNESTSVPENSIDSEGNEIVDTMTFTVDTKAPEIRNITNLEKSYIDADSVEVNYSIVDVGGLKSIEVIVNGKAVAEITDFKENLFSFDGSFTLKADTKEQTVQIIVTDLAGNVTDTSSEAFDTQGLYTFNPNVTVSTNIFVLWYANTPLFWGSIGGGVGVIGVAAVGIPKLRVRLRKRK